MTFWERLCVRTQGFQFHLPDIFPFPWGGINDSIVLTSDIKWLKLPQLTMKDRIYALRHRVHLICQRSDTMAVGSVTTEKESHF